MRDELATRDVDRVKTNDAKGLFSAQISRGKLSGGIDFENGLKLVRNVKE